MQIRVLKQPCARDSVTWCCEAMQAVGVATSVDLAAPTVLYVTTLYQCDTCGEARTLTKAIKVDRPDPRAPLNRRPLPPVQTEYPSKRIAGQG